MRVAVLYNLVEESSPTAPAENEVLETVESMEMSLNILGHEAVPLTVSWDALGSLDEVDVVINLAEGFDLDLKAEPYIAGVLEMMKVPYTGSPPHTLDICRNKHITKLLLESEGIPTPRSHLFRSTEEGFPLEFPVIVKPVTEDASIGIGFNSVVWDHETLMERTSWVMETFRQPALVEEYIDGREINVSVMEKGGIREVLPFSEIIFELPPGVPTIMAFETKWDEDHPYYEKTMPLCPAPVDERVGDRMKELALKCFDVVGARDYARVDMRIRGDEVFVIEVNPNPCMNPTGSGFIRSAGAAGMSFTDVVETLLDCAVSRKAPHSRFIPRRFPCGDLILKEAQPGDASRLLMWFTDEYNTRFMEVDGPLTRQDILIGILQTEDWDFIVHYSGRPIGFGSIYSIKKGTGELSFLIGEGEFKGKGIGKSLARCLLDFAFRELGLESVFASATVDNVPSIKALESIGFKRIGIRRAYQKVGDEYLDDILFDIRKEEFMKGLPKQNNANKSPVQRA